MKQEKETMIRQQTICDSADSQLVPVRLTPGWSFSFSLMNFCCNAFYHSFTYRSADVWLNRLGNKMSRSARDDLKSIKV